MGCGASSSPEERIPTGGEGETGETGEERVGEEEDIGGVEDVNNNGHRPKTSNPNNDR